tara:strand:+ start:119 stop:313 length:195 start_codon:yes stop_codon:yes gene_type:complete
MFPVGDEVTLYNWRSQMDTSKWKSILCPVPVYLSIKKMAKENGRTISGQLQMMHKRYLESYPEG